MALKSKTVPYATIEEKRDLPFSRALELAYLSRFRLDLDAETADLFIPFYIFQYGGKKFGFYPPVEASSSKGLNSRSKRMLAESLQSRIALLLKAQAEFIEKYLARAISALDRHTDLATTLRQTDDEVNLLKSRKAIDKMMMGLVKMRREGWISDSELHNAPRGSD